MTTAARDRLAKMLLGTRAGTFSVGFTTQPDDLNLTVDGLGDIDFPIRPAAARSLISLAHPARFGRGEQTLTDPAVRDTWEVPKHLVSARWDEDILRIVRKAIQVELGMPESAELTLDLHSLLVYEPGQFFLPHQDSEKNDAMVGTLVVTLPSVYTGGELVVRHLDAEERYKGTKSELSLVAFYADCRHEVLAVETGYRIALTYNLLRRGDKTAGDDSGAETVAELAALLREHFTTPAGGYGTRASLPPDRLVYLLDHEYSPAALRWPGLKGDDARRVSLLRAAAERENAEAVLALADIKTTHDAFEADDYYGRSRRFWDDDEDEDGDADYVVDDLIDTAVTLTHWTRPDGGALETTSLHVADSEVCASTPTDDFEPYESNYEGYQGNWGNTLDRQYSRAAVVFWPRELAFANRAETSPSWALDELAAMAAQGRAAEARAAAATLEPFWSGSLRLGYGADEEDRNRASGLLGKALLAADALADAGAATVLLEPFYTENLVEAHTGAFAALTGRFGARWAGQLLRTWFRVGETPGWHFYSTQRPLWAARDVPGLCVGLHASGDAGAQAARRLLDLTWDWARDSTTSALGMTAPSRREEALVGVAEPLAAVLEAAAAIGAADLEAAVPDLVRGGQGDGVAALEMAVLRAAAARTGAVLAAGTPLGALAADCAERLRARLARPARASDDYSIEATLGCSCELCETLRGFLRSRNRRTFDWPLAEGNRGHVHTRIDEAELPVTHQTRRQGRPDTLVLTKTAALHTRDRDARAVAEADLAWLAPRQTAGA